MHVSGTDEAAHTPETIAFASRPANCGSSYGPGSEYQAQCWYDAMKLSHAPCLDSITVQVKVKMIDTPHLYHPGYRTLLLSSQRARAHAHTRTHTQKHTHAHTHQHTHAHTDTHSLSLTHTYTHTHIHTRTHRHIHTHHTRTHRRHRQAQNGRRVSNIYTHSLSLSFLLAPLPSLSPSLFCTLSLSLWISLCLFLSLFL